VRGYPGIGFSTHGLRTQPRFLWQELRIVAVGRRDGTYPNWVFAIDIGEITLTNARRSISFTRLEDGAAAVHAGLWLVFLHDERKAISMALVDRALRWKGWAREIWAHPRRDEEFLLYHAEISATGFLELSNCPTTSISIRNWSLIRSYA